MTTARRGPVKDPPKLRYGDTSITLLDGGHLWLDGGAMFGIIPKPMWSKLTEVDEANRIPLAMTCLLVETGGKKILVETGAGTPAKYDAKEQGFFKFSPHWILDSLRAVGVEREAIDYVILTHLHFDHAGGGTMSDGPLTSDVKGGRGGHQPTFPRARYVVQRGEWEDAVRGHAVMTATYRPENLAPLEKAGLLWLADGDAEIVPDIAVRLLPGHTRCLQGVVIAGGGQQAVQPGDLMPTAAHVGLRFNMAYDLLPHANMLNKERLLKEGAERRWKLLLGQDPTQAAWEISAEGRGRFGLIPAE